jgi:hypothetical protein
MSRELSIVVGLMLAQVAGLVLLYVVAIRPLPALATVDLQAIYREKETAFGKQASAGLDAAARQAAIADVQKFSQAMPGYLAALSNECRCVVLLANAVASSAGHKSRMVDLTPRLRKMAGLP